MGKYSPSQMKRMIKQEAHALGFDLAGITGPEPPPHFDVYQGWIEAGYHGEMKYLARQRNLERRSDPREILPECQSILVLGMNYLPRDSATAQAGSSARVASYALGEDYHDVIPEKVAALVKSIEGWAGGSVANRYYTDTGPVLERDLAQRAGLGWIGKNTCLIHPRKGSYYFLAELLLELELPADEPMKADHCGSCTRCLEACPTQCILPDRTLDARRCISYLTIELKGDIPPELRGQIGDWAFGCDICQQVCPWNQRFAAASEETAFQPLPFFDDLQPEVFLNMSEQDYQDALRGSPLKRAKRRGLARNAAVVVGNQAHPVTIEALRQTLLTDPEPLPRQHAAWALGRFKEKAAEAALRSALEKEASKKVRAEIQAALHEVSE